MDNAITISDLSKHYHPGAGHEAITALDHLNLVVPTGQIVGLLGNHAAGKTTLLRLLCGTTPPTRGRITLNGEPLTPGHRPARQQIDAVLADKRSLDQRRTVQQLAVAASHVDASDQRYGCLMADLDLWPWRDTPLAKLSDGLRQTLRLALAILGNRPILALDEPFVRLDAELAARIGSWLRRISGAAGRTIVLASGRLDGIHDLCDRIVVLERGTISADVTLGATPGASDQRSHYRLAVQGHLGAHGVAWFEGLTVINKPDGSAEISGPIADQAALHGLLARVQTLGLPLLTVDRGPPAPLTLAQFTAANRLAAPTSE